jgi:hypothetical protein
MWCGNYARGALGCWHICWYLYEGCSNNKLILKKKYYKMWVLPGPPLISWAFAISRLLNFARPQKRFPLTYRVRCLFQVFRGCDGRAPDQALRWTFRGIPPPARRALPAASTMLRQCAEECGDNLSAL